MKCPYCAEEIKDEALVCRFCRQNLLSFKPVLERLSQIEDQITELAASLSRLQPEIQPERPIQVSVKSNEFYKRALIVVLTSITTIGSYWIFRSMMFYSNWSSLFLIISIACPLPFGLLYKLTVPREHLKVQAVLAIGIGLVNFVGITLVYRGRLYPPPHDWEQVFSIYTLGGGFLYLTGGIVGRWINKKKSPFEAETGYAVKLARKITGRNARTNEGANVVKRTAELLAALAPLLTFLGSLVAAYLSYKATINKK